jgi:hypothetical protein
MDTPYGESVNPLAVIHFASLVRAPCDVSFVGPPFDRLGASRQSNHIEIKATNPLNVDRNLMDSVTRLLSASFVDIRFSS